MVVADRAHIAVEAGQRDTTALSAIGATIVLVECSVVQLPLLAQCTHLGEVGVGWITLIRLVGPCRCLRQAELKAELL